MGGWLAATLRLVREVASSVPNVLFVLSVHDEAHLERTRFKPLPLLSALTTAAHWDIPVPGQTWFETSGGVSSQGADQDFGLWESKQWQKQLETKYPWENRTQRAFFRGHDWSASNAFTELLPTRPAEHCIKQHAACPDMSCSFVSFPFLDSETSDVQSRPRTYRCPLDTEDGTRSCRTVR